MKFFCKILLVFFMMCNFSVFALTESVQKDIAELKRFADAGRKEIRKVGAEQAYKELNDPKGKFRHGEMYLFVFGFNGKVFAHGGDPKNFIGKNMFNAKDRFGTPFFQLFVEAANRGGGIVSYYWPDPQTGVLKYKTSYIEPVDERTFIGVGVYKSLDIPMSQAEKISLLKSFVEEGIAYIKSKGATEAYKEFNNQHGKFAKGELYLFVCGSDGRIIVHGGDPKMINTNISNLQDEYGTPIFKMFTEAARAGGGMASYYWADYAKGGVTMFKTSYIKPLDKNYFVGAGYYGD